MNTVQFINALFRQLIHPNSCAEMIHFHHPKMCDTKISAGFIAGNTGIRMAAQNGFAVHGLLQAAQISKPLPPNDLSQNVPPVPLSFLTKNHSRRSLGCFWKRTTGIGMSTKKVATAYCSNGVESLVAAISKRRFPDFVTIGINFHDPGMSVHNRQLLPCFQSRRKMSFRPINIHHRWFG